MAYFQSINPFNQQQLKQYETISEAELLKKLEKAQSAFLKNKGQTPSQRKVILEKLALLLEGQQKDLSSLISLEMGKLIKEAEAEIEKCAWLCRYYAENGPAFLEPEIIASDADYSARYYEALGVILGVMPWNFPFWQVFRFAVPSLLAGNAVLLKHAPNVPQCALAIERLFREAGLAEGLFQNFFIEVSQLTLLLDQPEVKAASLTGSTQAGESFAKECGQRLLKLVLELGGSNAFILLPDADPKAAAALAQPARLLNAGQSCIAAKRFIVPSELESDFVAALKPAFEALKPGDPLDRQTQIAPLARRDLAEKLEQQVESSLAQGAELVLGGKRQGNFYPPTILGGVKPGMPAFNEELFGPVAAISTYESIEEAIELSNNSVFGLGVSLITDRPEEALKLVPQLEEGAVFINELVKSDPRLPFGGVKKSGYGRELSREGIREFVNIKTVYLKSKLD